jgi:hypothetical protein
MQRLDKHVPTVTKLFTLQRQQNRRAANILVTQDINNEARRFLCNRNKGYLSQDKLALLFIRDQTVGHATLNIQLLDNEVYCQHLVAIVQVGIHCISFIVQ